MQKNLDDFIELNKAYWPELKQKRGNQNEKKYLILFVMQNVNSIQTVKKIRDVAKKQLRILK